MNILLFGATGMIGGRVLNEALGRGHRVTAVVRDSSRLEARAGLSVVTGDLLVSERLPEWAQGHDAVVSAYAPPPDRPEQLPAVVHSLLSAATAAGARLLVVGGAGSLEVAPGVRLIDTPDFPAAWLAIARIHAETLESLQQAGAEHDWTYLSPAALIEPGQRTGVFRLGDRQLVADADGQSRISAEDYAVALVDELENPRHSRRQFTLAY